MIVSAITLELSSSFRGGDLTWVRVVVFGRTTMQSMFDNPFLGSLSEWHSLSKSCVAG